MAKTIFITGTNSGFGQATVELFAKQGWSVAATVRKTHIDKGLFKDLPNVTLYELDVTNYEQVNEVAEKAIQKFGKIDVLVNNAGYCLQGPTETTTMEQIKAQYETNVFGLFAVTKAFIPHFRQNNSGMIINLASSSALFNYPYIAPYGSSKWAVRGISEALGIELEPFNIQVKTIFPGAHATKIFTKIDDGTGEKDKVYQVYKPFYKNFLSAQLVEGKITPPSNIANEIWKAANNPKGKLNIVSGNDAKLFKFMKKLLPERVFQKIMIRSIKQPISKGEIAFGKWLLGGKNAKPLEVKFEEGVL